jgi:Transposase DDE domain
VVLTLVVGRPTAPNFGHLEPILNAARNELQAVGVADTPDVVVADAGYWHQDQMQRIIADGTQVLIPPDSSRRKAPRPGWDGGLYAFMRRVLDTDRGNELYRQRQQLIEPVFANTKFNRRFDRFHRRGRAAVRTEWRLIAATHNLLKLHRHQMAVA